MAFSDYIIYVDESGDHSLESVDPQYPVFVLAFCVIKKSDYTQTLVPNVQKFKFDWFGHDSVILHEREIRRAEAPFVFLGDPRKKDAFMDGLSAIVDAAPMKIIASVIRKDELRRRYIYPTNPYELALLFCMERTQIYLHGLGQRAPKVTHIVCEARGGSGGKEDKELELEFRRICDGANQLSRQAIDGFEIRFADKRANSTGLQIADLVARPIGLRAIRPTQPNRAFDLIRAKLVALKTFP